VNWPLFTEYTVNPIKIRYTAGYAAYALPKTAKQAMLCTLAIFMRTVTPWNWMKKR
jgi:hypothetical protein